VMAVDTYILWWQEGKKWKCYVSCPKNNKINLPIKNGYI
jgi:hypothetical protein